MTRHFNTVNFFASVLAYGVSISVGILYTPYLLKSLGPAAYGLIPLTFALIQYFGFVTQTVSIIFNRNLVESRENLEAFNEYVSAAFRLCLGISFIIAIFGLFAAFNIESLIVVTEENRDSVKILAASVAISLMLSTIFLPLNGIIFAENALFIQSIGQAFETICRVGLVIGLFIFFYPTLYFVALAITVASALGGAFLITAVWRLRPNLRITKGAVGKLLGAGVVSTGSGVIITQFGTLLLFNTDLLIVNLVYGPVLGGAYAAVAQWAVVLRGLGLSVAIGVNSHVMRAYQELKGKGLANTIQQSARLLAAFGGLPAGYMAGVSAPLISVWLGPQYTTYWPILAALAVPTAVNLVSVPLLATALAADRILNMGIVYILAGVAYVLIATVSAKLLNLGGVEVAAALGLTLLLTNHCFVIPYVARIIGVSVIGFYTVSILAVCWVAGAWLFTWVIGSLVDPDSWFDLFVVGLAVSPLYLAFLWMTSRVDDVSLVRGEVVRIFSIVLRRINAAI